MNNFLQHAHSIETFLSRNRSDTEAGTAWKRTPTGKPSHSFYHGSAGVMVYYIELYLATDDTDYLSTAISAGDNLLAYVNQKASAEEFITIGFYSGWPGLVYALTELFKVSHEPRFKKGAITALNRITAQASNIGAGLGWIEPIPFSDITGITGTREVIDLSVGSAGVGIIYLYAYRQGLLSDLELARKTADRLLEVAEATEDGLRWLMMVDMAFPFTAPNFAHGGAGVGYFLADLYEETGDSRYLEAAISAADYVKSRSVAQQQGHLVCHNEEQQPPTLFYLGVCHGPAGTGRFMYLLYKITGNDNYFDWITANFLGLLGTGAPEQRCKGLWNNHGQCCGDAGIGDYALFLYHETGHQHYLDYALRTARELMNTADSDRGLSWNMAEHRGRPEFVERQTGYMQGAAGIGSFMLHLATVLEHKPVKLLLPETPFSYTANGVKP